MLISYTTQTIQPDGTPDPSSPVAAGQVVFAASGVPAGRSLAWSVTRGAASQSGTLTPDATGAVSATVPLVAGLAEYTAGLGSASWADDGASWSITAGDGPVTVSLGLV